MSCSSRSLARPMRYFLAKVVEGPLLVVADRIDRIQQYLREEGLEDQFHPSYTRMVPAHHVTTIKLVGCPDPNPRNTRFFTPQPNRLPADLNQIGRDYVGELADACNRWLRRDRG